MAEPSSIVSRAISITLTLCAVFVTLLLAKRELFPSKAALSQVAPGREPEPVDDWEALKLGGHSDGPLAAPVTIVEFADFECPACGMFETRILAGIRANYGADVRVVFRLDARVRRAILSAKNGT